MDAKQFAWLYLIENGYGGIEPSYYGGWDLVDARMKKYWKSFDPASMKKINDAYMSEIKRVGVDWSKTQAPSSSLHSQFNGTFAETQRETEYLEGTLVLKNGEHQLWMAENLEVSNVFEMMARVHEASNRFIEIFGTEQKI